MNFQQGGNMSASQYLLGIDIGGTKLAAVVANHQGRLLHKMRQPTQAGRGAQAVLERILEMVRRILAGANLSPTDIACIGVSCPGPVDCQTGIIYSPPNLPGWKEVPLKAILQQEFGIPARFENDANAAAMAEMKFGAGKGRKNIIYLTMSTGIGGGIIIDGRLCRGAHNSAGEVGHQTLIPEGPSCGCGKHGCLEALCSGSALSRIMQQEARQHPDSLMLKLAGGRLEELAPPVLVEAARAGDELALRIWEQAGYHLGWGLANLANILDPEIFILGTIAVHAGELLLAPARKAMACHIFNRSIPLPPLVPAKLGDEIGEYGAIAIAMEDF
jgi:glucokinase